MRMIIWIIITSFGTYGHASADCLGEIRDFALEICGAIENSGEAKKLTASGEISLKAKGILKRVLGEAGGDVNIEYLEDSFTGVLRNQIKDDRFDTRACRRDMVLVARDEACVAYRTCRRPEFGLERYVNTKQYSGGSGWREGGYNQPAYCSDLERATIASLGIAGGDYKMVVIDSSERGRWVMKGLNPRHRQYHYQCTIEISWQPIYKSHSDPICGTE